MSWCPSFQRRSGGQAKAATHAEHTKETAWEFRSYFVGILGGVGDSGIRVFGNQIDRFRVRLNDCGISLKEMVVKWGGLGFGLIIPCGYKYEVVILVLFSLHAARLCQSNSAACAGVESEPGENPRNVRANP